MHFDGTSVIDYGSIALIERVFGFRAAEMRVPIVRVTLDQRREVRDCVVQRNRVRLVHPADRLIPGPVRLEPNTVSVDALHYRYDIDTETIRSHQPRLSISRGDEVVSKAFQRDSPPPNPLVL